MTAAEEIALGERRKQEEAARQAEAAKKALAAKQEALIGEQRKAQEAGKATLSINPVAEPAAAEKTATTPASSGLYSDAYYQAIRDKYLSQATSAEEQEAARQRRSQLAGAGVLSGTAYDTLQANRLGEITRAADEAVATAMIEAPEKERADLESQISTLAPLATAENASDEVKALYNQLLAKRFGITTGTTTTTSKTGTDTGAATGTINFLPEETAAEKQKSEYAANEPAYNEAATNYANIMEKIPGWITDTANSNRASYQAYQRLEDLASKLSAQTMTAAELTEFNKLLAAFKRAGLVGNYNESVFADLGYGSKATSALPSSTVTANYIGPQGQVISASQYATLLPNQKVYYRAI